MSITEGHAAPTARDATTARGLPFKAVLGLISGLSLLLVAQGPFRDVDIYWHLLAGEELASGHGPSDLGATWSFAPNPLPWTSTQWMGELVLHWIHAASGWAGIALYRTITAGLAIAALAASTLRGRPGAIAGIPFVIGLVAIAAFSQERTQQITYIGAAVLGGVIVGALTANRLPRWWVVVPLAIVWANVHGGWIVMPIAFGLIALGRSAEHGISDATARRSGLLALATALAGAVSPAGAGNITAVFRFTDLSSVIQEWGPVTPTRDVGILTLALVSVILLAWARPLRVPRDEVLVTLALLAFGWTAWRSIVVSILLLVPLVANRMTLAFPKLGARTEPTWSAGVGIALAGVLGAIGLASIPGQPHLPEDAYPFDLYEQAAQLPTGSQRILNDYNLAGMILYFGGSSVQVGIDGRTDRYGAEYIEDYLEMTKLEGDWLTTFEELAPTAALLRADAPLTHVLMKESGWGPVGSQKVTEGEYMLLLPPR